MNANYLLARILRNVIKAMRCTDPLKRDRMLGREQGELDRRYGFGEKNQSEKVTGPD